MDERSRGAADDLRFIKSVLSDSQPGYGAISPLFSGICVIWWVYSLLSLALLAFGTRFAYAGNEAAFGRYSRLSSLPELLLCAALLCAYLVLRRGKGTSAFGCSKRLAGVWSVSIFAFALARLALLVLTILGNRVPGIFGGGTPDFSALVRVGTAATALGRALFIVFPAIPLMITARLLANRALTALGVNCGLRHCCNSAGVIDYPQYAMDMVRPGIATYGLAPSDDLRGALELRPLLSWRTSICQLRDFEPGVDISYGRTYTTTRPTRVAVLSVGYADGLCRTLSGRVELLLHGRRVPVIGRICMDMCMADVTEVPETQVGDAVTIIGSDGAETITADEFAGLLGTISYEAICDIGKRVPRIYYRDGKVTEELRYIV